MGGQRWELNGSGNANIVVLESHFKMLYSALKYFLCFLAVSVKFLNIFLKR